MNPRLGLLPPPPGADRVELHDERRRGAGLGEHPEGVRPADPPHRTPQALARRAGEGEPAAVDDRLIAEVERGEPCGSRTAACWPRGRRAGRGSRRARRTSRGTRRAPR